MAYIVMTQGQLTRPLRTVEDASAVLRAQGHSVVVVTSMASARRVLTEKAPDVLVLDSRGLEDGMQFDVLDILAEVQPGNRTRIVQVAMLDPFGVPSLWRDDLVDSYVIEKCSYWQLVVSVEYFLRPPRF